MILDGYDAVQESSTDEEIASSFTLQPVTGTPSVDSSHQQQHSPQNALSEGAISPSTPEFLVQRRWRAVEDACSEVQSPSAWTDSQSQILEYIHKIEADLEHLKVRPISASEPLVLRTQLAECKFGLMGSSCPKVVWVLYLPVFIFFNH